MGFLRSFIDKFNRINAPSEGIMDCNYDQSFDDNYDIRFSLKRVNDEIQAMKIRTVKEINVKYDFVSIKPHFITNGFFYGGGEAVPIDKSLYVSEKIVDYQYLSQKIALKKFTEASLKQREKAFKTKLEERYGFAEFSSDDYLNDIVYARIASPRPSKRKRITLKDIKKIASSINFTENLSTLLLLEDVTLDYRDYKHVVEEYESFRREYEAIKQMSRFLRSLSRQISFLLNLVKRRLRNLRDIFTKQHSFHFKNLDDYHSASFNLSF